MSGVIAVELVVAAMLFGAVKFLAVRRRGLIWLLAAGLRGSDPCDTVGVIRSVEIMV